MKILQLCKKFPYPLKDGESIANTYMSKALNELGNEITLLAMNTVKHFFDLNQLPNDFDHYDSIHTIEVDNRVKVVDAFLNLFSKNSYHVERFISEEFNQKLIELLKKTKFDLVQLETLYLTPYVDTIRKYSNAKIVMRSHNVEHEIWERVIENTVFFPKKKYLQYLTTQLKKYEIEHLNSYDTIVAITQRDLDYFSKLGLKKQGLVAPIGLDMTNYCPDYDSYQKPLSLSFIGSLDWMPNIEGLEWFLGDVMPKINERFPKIALHVAGRNMPSSLFQYQSQTVILHGEVESSTAFLNQHSMMIVPLLSGSGMRAKILEAMALGKVSLTTSIGVEGIKAANNKEILVANTAEEFITAIDKAQQLGGQLETIGRNARTFAVEHFDNKSIVKRYLNELREMSEISELMLKV
jgi:polysaccharide biosynthesis protein PslH